MDININCTCPLELTQKILSKKDYIGLVEDIYKNVLNRKGGFEC